MFGLGAGEVLLIVVFALIFIGPKKLPELAKSLGKGIREFQKAKDDIMHQVQEGMKEPDVTPKEEAKVVEDNVQQNTEEEVKIEPVPESKPLLTEVKVNVPTEEEKKS